MTNILRIQGSMRRASSVTDEFEPCEVFNDVILDHHGHVDIEADVEVG